MKAINENEIKLGESIEETHTAPVFPILLDLDEETIQILLDDQIATGG
ncbi:hypothetical protein [Bellilinea sp.]|nr:hypothetical protein [Bellilinea sp.]